MARRSRHFDQVMFIPRNEALTALRRLADNRGQKFRAGWRRRTAASDEPAQPGDQKRGVFQKWTNNPKTDKDGKIVPNPTPSRRRFWVPEDKGLEQVWECDGFGSVHGVNQGHVAMICLRSLFYLTQGPIAYLFLDCPDSDQELVIWEKRGQVDGDTVIVRPAQTEPAVQRTFAF